MKCAKCGFLNPAGAKFCNQCGSPLIAKGAPSDDRLDRVRSLLPSELADKIRRESKKIVGERKYVTVVFADISGFTPLSEQMEPEELTTLMNDVFSSLSRVIYKYEGTIDKFIGDCVMVLFGAPITQEDGPERAIRCGLDMLDEINKFGQVQAPPLQLHIGINAGWVIAGSIGSDLKMEYTVMGDTVNLAERLTELAKWGEILVSDGIYQDTKNLFTFTRRPGLKIRGKEERVTVYLVRGFQDRLLRRFAPRNDRRGVLRKDSMEVLPGLLSPIVGRDNELGVLDSVIDRVSNQGYVVCLIGEAGIGKSRLVHELRTLHPDVLWLSGRCPSYGRALAFWVFKEIFKGWLGVGELDSEEVIRNRLMEKLDNLFPGRISEFWPYLLSFLGLKVPESVIIKVRHLAPEALKLQIFVSIKAVLTELSKGVPLVLYFEDLQWVDVESVALIKFLLAGLKAQPILFLFEFRPELKSGAYEVKEEGSKEFKTRYLEFELTKLTDEAGEALITNLLHGGELPSDLKGLVLKSSGGNPFYIEEFIKSLTDKGIIIYDSGVWKVVGSVQKIEVPSSIEVIIGSRIDRLSDSEKSVLQAASVIGKDFLYRVLECISGVENLSQEMSLLVDKEFIFESDGKRGAELVYEFRHPLIREVAYNSLLKHRRRELHNKVGMSIEDIFGDELTQYYQFLAYHYYEGENWERALFYSREVGNDARERYNNLSAIDYYERALKILDFFEKDKIERAELLEKIGEVKVRVGRLDDAFSHYNMALEHSEPIERKAELIRKIGLIFYTKGEYNEATVRYESAINMLKEELPNSPVLVETMIDYAFLLAEGKGEYERAEALILRALELITKEKELKLSAKCCETLAAIYIRKGDYETALAYSQKVAQLYERLEDKEGIMKVLNLIGIIYRHQGELVLALEHYKKALEVADEIGLKKSAGVVSGNLGIVHKEKGEMSNALEYYKKALIIAEEVGNKKGVGLAYGNMGNIYLSQGELGRALENSERALAIFKEIGNKQEIGMAYDNIGTVYYERGDLEEALIYYKRCLNIFEEMGDKEGIGVSLHEIGTVQVDLGEFREAWKSLWEAEKLFMEIGNKVSLSDVYTSFSVLSLKEGKVEDAISFAQKALEFAEETKAKEQQIASLRALGVALPSVEYLMKSLKLADESNLTLEVAKSSYELGKFLNNMGRTDEAGKYLTCSTEIFNKAGAELWLKKLNELSSME